jgi:hypothetical protein
MKRLAITAPTFLLALLLAFGCVAPEKAREPGGSQQMLPNGGGTRDPYLQVIENFSRGETEYEGLYNQFTYKATIVNSAVRESMLLKEADYFKWDPSQLQIERDKAAEKMATATDVFISFYTPERKNDNLTDSKSIWRVYLDFNGKRYEGKPRKARKLFAEMATLFPYHTRWNTAYYIEFQVPTAEAEGGSSKLTVTGPLGIKEVEFPSIR